MYGVCALCGKYRVFLEAALVLENKEVKTWLVVVVVAMVGAY